MPLVGARKARTTNTPAATKTSARTDGTAPTPIHRGTFAEHGAETVHNGVLGLEGGVVRIGENLAVGRRFDEKGAVDVENFLPLDFINVVVELMLVVGLKLGEGLEYGKVCNISMGEIFSTDTLVLSLRSCLRPDTFTVCSTRVLDFSSIRSCTVCPADCIDTFSV